MSALEEPSVKKLRMNDDLEVHNCNFNDLPNEILSKILDYLHIKDLIRCGQTFKRLRFAVHDEFLWKKVNLSNKTLVPAGLLQMILYLSVVVNTLILLTISTWAMRKSMFI